MATTTQSISEKALAFQRLHTQPGIFIIPNPWDAGSAKLLAALDFKALATTSAGLAFSKGVPDNMVNREDTFRHLADIVNATELPVSADLGNAFADKPEDVANNIKLAMETGISGASVEDGTTDSQHPVYALAMAKERIKAAAIACKESPHPFLLTARADNYFLGNPDLADTIKRLQHYQEAGADVLFAPGITKKEDIKSILASIDKPLNVLAGINGFTLSVDELGEMGVKRISLGASLAKAALTGFVNSCKEIKRSGTFGYASQIMSFAELNNI